jgi:hypothetical protein
MPYHRVPKGRLHEDITSIEREGEQIVAVKFDPDEPVVHVFTAWLGARPVLEVRSA